jgi:sugar transferase (PEP-CTERM/EpsH1 system associated)
MNSEAVKAHIGTVAHDQTGAPPLIAHVLFHFGVGGLENGVANLINGLPRTSFRHAVICVRGAEPMQRLLQRDDVEIIPLAKAEGVEIGCYLRAWREIRRLQPAIVHTRNLAALEMQLPAALAGGACRVHSEHGREGIDLHGNYRLYNGVRRGMRPLVHQYVAVSRDLQRWLVQTIGVKAERVQQIYNGVDTERFRPRTGAREPIGPPGFIGDFDFVVTAVGRLAPIKDHMSLIRAIATLVAGDPDARRHTRLVIVGDGPCRMECERLVASSDIGDIVWMAGERSDIPALLRASDVLCLTSTNEGINNTILEAMATGLPVIATKVGGNPELVEHMGTGMLVPPADAHALAAAIDRYRKDPELCRQHGAAGRRRVEAELSLDTMIEGYAAMYQRVLLTHGRLRRG